MKKLFLLLCLLSSPAHAALSEADRAIHSRDYVQLLNPGFEQGKSKWTASAGTFTTQSTSVMAGSAASWVLSGATGSLSQDVTPSVATPGVPYESSMWVNTGASTFQVCARQAGVETQCAPVSADSNWHKYSLNYSAPSSGSVGVDLSTTQSTTGTAYVDNAYTGIATNLAQVSQARLFGSIKYAQTASCFWSNSSSTSYNNLGANSSCSTPTTTGAATAPGTKIPAAVFATMPPGDYEVVIRGAMDHTSAVNDQCNWRFSDGTNTTASSTHYANSLRIADTTLTGRFTYTTAQSNVTIQPQARSGSASIDCRWDAGNSFNNDFEMDVYYFPNSSQTTLGPDATAASWTGFQTGSFTIAGINASFVDFGANALAITQRLNTNMGTVTQASGNVAGITFTPPKTGKYQICLQALVDNSSVSGVQGLQLTDGTTVMAQTGQVLPSATTQPINMCLDSQVTSLSPVTVKLQAKNTVNTTINLGAGGNLEWSIVQKDAGQPAPLLTGSVTSNTSGLERVERLRVDGTCTTGTCTISSQSGSWASSVTWTANGRYAVNIAAGEFSAAPTCTCSPGTNATQTCYNNALPTTSALDIQLIVASTGTGTNSPFEVICHGPR